MKLNFQNTCLFFIFSFIFLIRCSSDQSKDSLFDSRTDTSINFSNNLTYTEEFNPYTYRNFYNGGGVALGDINNDGLVDIYFTGNQVDNKLYLNKGNWVFEDITTQSKTSCPGVWSSGANFVDINGDGYLDLYVCKAGKPEGGIRHNELFINNRDLTFTESSAAYNLDINGLGIQSAFFDYDKDGDLDCYLLNNSLKSVSGFNLEEGARNRSTATGNKFLENRDGKFYDISNEAGIYTSAIGFGLGITLSDLNNDTWPDLYISNDFFEKDYMYINQGDGTFKEQSEEFMVSMSLGSMGADAADLNNDGLSDIMVTEMLPSSVESRKTNAIYDSWKKYNLSVSKGYFHQQPRNVLQRNMGDSLFLEVGRFAGVEATDWSWSALMADMDNDGKKDIFVSNGIYKDLLDRDYLTFVANDTRVKNLISQSSTAITSLIDTMPSRPLSNFAFHNKGGLQFENKAQEWGLDLPGFSNGCAFADLDNDGDLDLVVNNVNALASIYENKSEKNGNNSLTVHLVGEGGNTKAIGSKVIVTGCGMSYTLEHYPSRGFQSSHSNYLTFGLGVCDSIEKVEIIWPTGEKSIKRNVSSNSRLTVKLSSDKLPLEVVRDIAKKKNVSNQIDFKHRENAFNHFDRERLLHKMNTKKGPAIAVGDCNGDGKNDFFIGGAKNQMSVLYLSSGNDFVEEVDYFEPYKKSELVEAMFFDSDQDGDLDLYMAHGGSAFSRYSQELDDVILLNNGKGEFTGKAKMEFPTKIGTGSIAITDADQDGDEDVYLVGRNAHLTYGEGGKVYLLENKGGNAFQIIESESKPSIYTSIINMSTKETQNVVTAGEWSSISIAESMNELSTEEVPGSKGLWNHLNVYDFNQDGIDDLFAGNAGLNTTLSTNHVLIVNDFDKNGSKEQVLCVHEKGAYFPVLDMDELGSQIPSIKKKVTYYKDYAKMSIRDLLGAHALDEARIFTLDELQSCLFIHQNGGLEKIELPKEVQYSCVHTSKVYDVNRDGVADLIIGGNNKNVKPQFGRDDASCGWILYGKIENGNYSISSIKNLGVKGEIRDIEILDDKTLLIGINNEKIQQISI